MHLEQAQINNEAYMYSESIVLTLWIEVKEKIICMSNDFAICPKFNK